MEVLVFVLVATAVVTVGGYLWNNVDGPGDTVRDPEVPNRRHTWVP